MVPPVSHHPSAYELKELRAIAIDAARDALFIGFVSMAGVNYLGGRATTILAGWEAGDLLMFRVLWAWSSLVSFSTAVWQAKRVRP